MRRDERVYQRLTVIFKEALTTKITYAAHKCSLFVRI
jgi:hypothetical protein